MVTDKNGEEIGNEFLYEQDYYRSLDVVLYYQDKRFEASLFMDKMLLKKLLMNVEIINRFYVMKVL